MGTIKMKGFVIILMLAFIWIKPSTATYQPTHTGPSLLTMLKNIFGYYQKNLHVEPINKNEKIFYFEKLQSSPIIVKIIVSYVDLYDYVSMLQVSMQLYQIIPNQVGINHLFDQYTKLLQQQPAPLTVADIMMLRHYAQFLESRPIPGDYVDLKPFYLPVMSTEHQNEIRSMHVNVPVLATIKTNNGLSISYDVVHIYQCNFCQHDYGENDKEDYYQISLWHDNKIKILFLKYDTRNNLPNTVSFTRDQNYFRIEDYVIKYKSNERGYYQTFHSDENNHYYFLDYRVREQHIEDNDDMVMLFYYPYRK